ncbi:head completion/stabilization protein [Citrobacter freundii]|uniref:head completion/stabilization protein n=1 Tax=Citrobacter freundii TaxID=546 RepID=UPI001787550F|nr:head completion/stabilization protein [Citrobacter freundii]ELQ7794651.1 head completion/stabilization protein [Citrobacter freundii]MBE0099019.1 head completion/stabilization protein [Citrobacter freundii]MEA8857467.1 head completion/stabilization protein [Citrobacter freundii]MEB1001335.1 head completion/stabilization protein [Citrobacter freundii]
MKFVTPEQAPDSGKDIITNTPFWPGLDITEFRAEMRTDGTVTPARLRQAVLTAIAEVNAELHDFRLRQMSAGYTSLAEVPADEIDGESQRLQLYRRAVWCWTKATLTERYRDFDATGSGNKKADELVTTVDDLWRDVNWSLSRLQDKPRMTVELI